MSKQEKRSVRTSSLTSFQGLQKYLKTQTQFQAAAQDNQLWQPDYSALPDDLDKLFGKLPDQEISGCSFRFFCTFTLQTCYFSGRDRAGKEKEADNKKDETPNNHLCRDWVFGHPLAKAGAWKRLFRSCWPNQDAEELKRLFGPEDIKEEKDARKAELKFHHAFFPLNSVGKALIAPRDPKTGKVNHGPITYEVVNSGSRCDVVIDYLPRRDFNAVEAERVLFNLVRAALAMKTQSAAIGGKSGIWGRIHLTACSVERGPDVRRSNATEKIRDRRTA
jgi:hypothetical protein